MSAFSRPINLRKRLSAVEALVASLPTVDSAHYGEFAANWESATVSAHGLSLPTLC